MQKKNCAAAREEAEVGSWDEIEHVAGWRPRVFGVSHFSTNAQALVAVLLGGRSYNASQSFRFGPI